MQKKEKTFFSSDILIQSAFSLKITVEVSEKLEEEVDDAIKFQNEKKRNIYNNEKHRALGSYGSWARTKE